MNSMKRAINRRLINMSSLFFFSEIHRINLYKRPLVIGSANFKPDLSSDSFECNLCASSAISISNQMI